MIYRSDNRQPDQMRELKLTPDYLRTAEGSCLIEVGHTRVLCTATIEESVPGWMRNQGKGWVTSEYGMLPRATLTRTPREAARGKQGGRTHEIQRLIGRSMRAVVQHLNGAELTAGEPTYRFYVTDSVEKFHRQAPLFLGFEAEHVERADLDAPEGVPVATA